MAKWMIIHPNMRWDIIKFEKQDDNRISINMVKEKKIVEGTIDGENEFTKVIRVILDEGSTKIHLADFDEIDKFFEENTINFKNRRGLRKEIRRYIEFSLN